MMLSETQVREIVRAEVRSAPLGILVRQLQDHLRWGTGSPEGVVTAGAAVYLDVDGGAGVTLYVKEDPALDNTGWVAK